MDPLGVRIAEVVRFGKPDAADVHLVADGHADSEQCADEVPARPGSVEMLQAHS